MSTPSVYIKSAIFSDDTLINFNKRDIVIFVGPNNAGKSEALRNIKEKYKDRNNLGLAIKVLSLEKEGTQDDLGAWLDKTCRKTTPVNSNSSNPYYSKFEASINRNDALMYWKHSEGLGTLHSFFIYHLTTDLRLNSANPAPNIAMTRDNLSHPIHYLYRDDRMELKISNYFRKAFSKDLIVHRNAGNEIPLYCGERPTLQTGQDRLSAEYVESLEKLPTLHTQGDGMRAFVGVLLHSLVVEHTVVLIDEPDLFLHPPQARLLGQMLVSEVPNNRQMFIATHSGDFLRGLLDIKSDRVRIIRIQREGNINVVNELDNAGIKNIWQDTLLKHSNILDGLFHEKVVICESDSDCRFYAAMHDTILDPVASSPRRDIMFTHCGGKARLPIVIQSLRELKVSLSIVSDFDVLNDEQPLRSIYEKLGGDWNDIKNDWSLVKKSIEQKKPELNTEEVKKEIQNVLSATTETIFSKESAKKIQAILRRSSPWSHAKEVGKSFVPSGNPTQAYNRLFDKLREKGLFVVEVGELEGFARSVGGHGPKWVNSVLEKNLSEDSELEEARRFIKRVI